MKINFFKEAEENQLGFTLVEMLAATVISLIILVGVFQVFNIMTKNFNESRQNSEMQQEVRYALNYVSEHLKLAGNGVPPVSGWPVITNQDGGAGADSVGVIGCYKSLVVQTTQNMGNEGSQIKVSSADDIEEGDLIIISYPPFGWQEIFMTTKLSSELHVYHDAFPPYNPTNKLDHKYPEGSVVSVATHYSFFVREDEEGHPNLMVNTQMNDAEILAGDIDDFQIRFKMKDNTWLDETNELADIRMIEISITARTPQPIDGYIDPVHGDSYKRVNLKTVVIPKNVILVYK